MSSAQVAMCGSRSLKSMPHWPCFVNLRGLPMSAAVSFLMKAKRTFLVMLSGSGWPFSSLSFGFGSKRSIWVGAPSMKMKMQFFAFAGKCGLRGKSGSFNAAASQPRSRGEQAFLGEHRAERHHAEAVGRRGEELTARLLSELGEGVHGRGQRVYYLTCNGKQGAYAVNEVDS